MSATKVISFRIPLTDYAELLSKANEANMNVADYVIFAMFSDRQTLLRADRRVARAEKEIDDFKIEATELRATIEKKNQQIAEMSASLARQNGSIESLVEKHNTFVSDLKSVFEKLDEESFSGKYKVFIEMANGSFWESENRV